jgi:type II secretory pathway pseudopilin PulG
MMMIYSCRRECPGTRYRPGITLTEILIAIMILGIGLVSLATLFPIGLIRLRDANRSSRSALLSQSAEADLTSRGLLNSKSFPVADLYNYYVNTNAPPWWFTDPNGVNYNPLIQDTPFYGGTVYDANGNLLGASALGSITKGGTSILPLSGPGLPIAYDPLWRYQTGLYIDPLYQSMPEARFASGIGFIQSDPSDAGTPSAWGLQRLTNFNRPAVMTVANNVPPTFVSPEDVVWQDTTNHNYTLAWNPSVSLGNGASPVVPDLSISYVTNGQGTRTNTYQPVLDWRYSWMFTGVQTSSANSACFDGNIVILENRSFGYSAVTGPFGSGQLVDGETVVEGIFGYSTNVSVAAGYKYGYGSGADRTVLLRWSTSVADPVVRAGDWIADVTYERNQQVIYNPTTGSGRFFTQITVSQGVTAITGYPNFTNQLEWDNLPAQRCFWYQVQKVAQPGPDPYDPTNLRAMVVYVNQDLQAKTLLQPGGQPWVRNAALIAPNVINVIPKTIFVR